MRYKQLGNTDLKVSTICLGTMTYGEQNSEQEGHQQLDYALAQGVNFIDTAELYAIPPCAETYGRTESIIGSWLHKRAKRDDIIIASKIAGPGPDWIPHIREGQSRFDANNIALALEHSLKRLQTDYIDLYQLHWPERKTNFFGQLGYQYDNNAPPMTPVRETLEVLAAQIKAGKIRHIGLSNETPWGIMEFLRVAKELSLPHVVSVQNPYCLLNRSFEVGNAEIAHRENVGLLAYSPLGFGVLSGKYLHGASPEAARITRWPDYSRYSNTEAVAATEAYVALAQEQGLEPSQMALAYVNSRSFVTANIIGATSMAQLQSNIASIDLELQQAVLDKIESIHKMHPNPAP